jgi:hypothetical protein
MIDSSTLTLTSKGMQLKNIDDAWYCRHNNWKRLNFSGGAFDNMKTILDERIYLRWFYKLVPLQTKEDGSP